MRNYFHRVLVILILLSPLGCETENQRLQEERSALLQEKSHLQAQLRQNTTPASQLSTEQLSYFGQLDRRVHAIDNRVAQINSELAGPRFDW